MPSIVDYKNTKFPLKLNGKNVITIPFDEIFKTSKLKELNTFVLKYKRSYIENNGTLLCSYINYFIEHYDKDNELLLGYLRMKFMIDNNGPKYSKKAFMSDLYDHIISDSMIKKIKKLTEDNYMFDLESNKKNKKNMDDSTVFDNEQSKILYDISMAMKIVIPPLVHYMYVTNVPQRKRRNVILKCFEGLFKFFEGDNDIYSKLSETVNRVISRTIRSDKGHWYKVEIQGKDISTEVDKIVGDVIIDIMFKYVYHDKHISLNKASIKKMKTYMFKHNFEYDYNAISDTKDADGLSGFDKFEIALAKFDESMAITASLNIQQSIQRICDIYEIEINDEEVLYYEKNIQVKPYQKELVFLFFAKYFNSIKDLNSIILKDYCKLIIILKVILYKLDFKYMHHILSGEVVEIGTKKMLNKKQMTKMTSSPRYEYILEKYSYVNNLIIEQKKLIEEYINTILNSRILLVDYELREYQGKEIKIKDNVDMICDEFLRLIEPI